MDSSRANDVAIGLPLVISLVTILGTIVIHALALLGILHFIRRQHLLRRTGVRFWRDVAIVSGAILLAGVAHLVDVFIWAVVFVLCGEFSRLAPAFYSSATLYTTLGYGDAVMSSSWKMLGPFETADGMLMFGLSTAIAIAVVFLIVRTRFYDIPNF
jgi:hypothetical protein